MLIDCATCMAPPHACRDCVVTVLLDSPAPTRAATPAAAVEAPETLRTAVELDDAEQSALAQLSAAGLVPPLRLVARTEPDSEASHQASHRQVRGIA